MGRFKISCSWFSFSFALSKSDFCFQISCFKFQFRFFNFSEALALYPRMWAASPPLERQSLHTLPSIEQVPQRLMLSFVYGVAVLPCLLVEDRGLNFRLNDPAQNIGIEGV